MLVYSISSPFNPFLLWHTPERRGFKGWKISTAHHFSLSAGCTVQDSGEAEHYGEEASGAESFVPLTGARIWRGYHRKGMSLSGKPQVTCFLQIGSSPPFPCYLLMRPLYYKRWCSPLSLAPGDKAFNTRTFQSGPPHNQTPTTRKTYSRNLET